MKWTKPDVNTYTIDRIHDQHFESVTSATTITNTYDCKRRSTCGGSSSSLHSTQPHQSLDSRANAPAGADSTEAGAAAVAPAAMKEY